MTPDASMIGLLGCAMLLAAVVVVIVRRWPAPLKVRIAVVLISGLGGLLPVDGLFLAVYLRGVVGDLSVTGLVLIFLFLSSYVLGRRLLAERDWIALTVLLAVTAVILYPMALGLGYFDPYALGYESVYFRLSLLLVALMAWYVRLYLIVTTIVLAGAGDLGDVFESDNLWDYLIDPLASVYALVRLPAIARTRLAADRVGLRTVSPPS